MHSAQVNLHTFAFLWTSETITMAAAHVQHCWWIICDANVFVKWGLLALSRFSENVVHVCFYMGWHSVFIHKQSCIRYLWVFVFMLECLIFVSSITHSQDQISRQYFFYHHMQNPLKKTWYRPTVYPAHIISYVTLKDHTGNNIKKCPDFFNLNGLFLIQIFTSVYRQPW